MAPFWLQKSSKILPKIDPKRHQFFDRFLHGFFYRFLIDFGGQLGAMLATFSLKKSAAVTNTRGFFVALLFFLHFFARPRGVPHPTARWGTHPWPSFWEVLAPCWHHFDAMLGPFAAIARPIFASSFLPSWLHLGSQVGTMLA